MILEIIASMFVAAALPPQNPTPLLDERPTSITGPDASAYFSWLSTLADQTADEVYKDGCQTRTVGTFIPTLWAISEVPAYLDENAAGEQMIVERVRVAGCGADALQNIGVFTGKNGRRWSVTLMLGEGRASPRESTGRVSEAFRVAMPHFDRDLCDREEALRTMRVDPVSLPWGGGTESQWSELWPVSVCGYVMPVRMDFTRNPDGSLTSQAGWLEPAERP